MRRIAGVKRANKRRMDEVTVETGVKESFKKKLVWTRLIWAGHVERIGDEKFAKRGDAQNVEGKGGVEEGECDGRTALREIWKEWEENGEQHQKIDGVGDW